LAGQRPDAASIDRWLTPRLLCILDNGKEFLRLATPHLIKKLLTSQAQAIQGLGIVRDPSASGEALQRGK
jgi:hypothetical protein